MIKAVGAAGKAVVTEVLDLVRKVCSSEIVNTFIKNLDRVRCALIKWSRVKFPNNKRKIDELMSELRSVLAGQWSCASVKEVELLTKKIEDFWDKEEL